jgi:hypothetical protein
MNDRNANPLHAVSTLLEERQRYEAWLSQLESRRSSTPPHVYARVHADYDKRLAEVMERLGSRTGELHEMSRELRARIDRVQEEENRRRDERAEAELRATVGEFTTQEWNELRERTDNEIVRLGTEAASLRDELARLDALLRTAATPHRSAENAAVPDSSSGATASSSAPSAPPPSSASPEPRPGTRAFDELAFLQSVVDPKDASRRASASASSEAPASRPAASASADVRQPTPAAPPVAQPSSGSDGAPAGARATEPGRRMPTPTEAPPPMAPPVESPVSVQRDSVPSFLKDVPNEQVKTLRCQECGTMNYPTEWYCERCGGELAAM